MAGKDEKNFVLDSLERQWVQQSIKTQRAVLVRKKNLERPGSEIEALRAREIQALDVLSAKLA